MGILARVLGFVWRRWADYQSVVAILDVLDIKTAVGGGLGFLGMIFIGATNMNWSAPTVILAALAAGALVSIIMVAVRIFWRLEPKKSAHAQQQNEFATTEARPIKPIADVDAREPFFQILEASEWRKEQDRTTTDTTHLVYNWREVRLSGEIHKALRNSRLDAWGEECLHGTATTPEKPIPPDSWDKVEIAFDRTSFARTAAYFKGYTSRNPGPMAWVAVKFSRQQIYELFPFASSDDYRPIFEAIKHVSVRTGEPASAKFWPATRRALRQAAYDKRVKVRGRKHLPENNPHTGSEYSELFTDVDSSYWVNSEINVLATSADNQSMYHTEPQTASAWGKHGIYERNRYIELKINWSDVLKEWP